MDEKDREIVKKFKCSWTSTRQFYEELIAKYPEWHELYPLRRFLHDLEKQGEDKYFRLGTSLNCLIISRSFEQRLRIEQKHVEIRPIDANGFEVRLKDGHQIYCQYRVSNLNDEKLANLLNSLKQIPID